MLIVESEKDDLVPPEVIQNYVNAVTDNSRLTYKLMQKATHSLTEKKWGEFIKMTDDWLKDMVEK